MCIPGFELFYQLYKVIIVFWWGGDCFCLSCMAVVSCSICFLGLKHLSKKIFFLFLQRVKILNSHLFKDLEIFIFECSFPPLMCQWKPSLIFTMSGGKRNTNHMSRVFLQHHSSNFRCTAWKQLQSADNLWSRSDMWGRGVLFKMHNKAVVSSPGSRDGSSPGEMRDSNVAVVEGMLHRARALCRQL